jgi:hypothetical protein
MIPYCEIIYINIYQLYLSLWDCHGIVSPPTFVPYPANALNPPELFEEDVYYYEFCYVELRVLGALTPVFCGYCYGG